MFSTVISAIITIVVVTVVLVALLLFVKLKLTPFPSFRLRWKGELRSVQGSGA